MLGTVEFLSAELVPAVSFGRDVKPGEDKRQRLKVVAAVYDYVNRAKDLEDWLYAPHDVESISFVVAQHYHYNRVRIGKVMFNGPAGHPDEGFARWLPEGSSEGVDMRVYDPEIIDDVSFKIDVDVLAAKPGDNAIIYPRSYSVDFPQWRWNGGKPGRGRQIILGSPRDMQLRIHFGPSFEDYVQSLRAG